MRFCNGLLHNKNKCEKFRTFIFSQKVSSHTLLVSFPSTIRLHHSSDFYFTIVYFCLLLSFIEINSYIVCFISDSSCSACCFQNPCFCVYQWYVPFITKCFIVATTWQFVYSFSLINFDLILFGTNVNIVLPYIYVQVFLWSYIFFSFSQILKSRNFGPLTLSENIKDFIKLVKQFFIITSVCECSVTQKFVNTWNCQAL